MKEDYISHNAIGTPSHKEQISVRDVHLVNEQGVKSSILRLGVAVDALVTCLFINFYSFQYVLNFGLRPYIVPSNYNNH